MTADVAEYPDALLISATSPISVSCSNIADTTLFAVILVKSVATKLLDVPLNPTSNSFIDSTMSLVLFVFKFAILPISSCTSVIASTRFVVVITIASEPEAGVFNSIAVPNAASLSTCEDIFAAAILFDASVCGAPKFCVSEKLPVFVLNSS